MHIAVCCGISVCGGRNSGVSNALKLMYLLIINGKWYSLRFNVKHAAGGDRSDSRICTTCTEAALGCEHCYNYHRFISKG